MTHDELLIAFGEVSFMFLDLSAFDGRVLKPFNMLHETRMIRGIGLVLFTTNSQTFEWVKS